ncbi:MAG TPA: VWA domain-containing protein [Deltaproteobacteria bacterium]|nr:VWA domain-containing protein [Deltaproteobacteria bacterium]
MRVLFGLGLWLAVGCQTEEFPAPIEGSAYRITDDTPAEGSEIWIDMFPNRRACANAKVVEIEDCLPRADRASGELRVSFDLKDPQSSLELSRALSKEQLMVTQDGSAQDDFELIPHDPVITGQLFILLIDGSGSMYADDQERIRKVYSALLRPSVIQGFFPEGNRKTGVVLLRFSSKVSGIDGGAPKILRSPEEYEASIRDHLLQRSGGYTHLYEAVQYAVTDLLRLEEIERFLTVKAAEPTLVVLTDGFNNEDRRDTCADNVPRLQRTIDLLREVRANEGGATRPTVYTVGLGVRYREENKPKGLNRPVTTQGLCGRYGDYPIDPSLEDAGIDHVSMQWIAEAGGGYSFVKRKPRGLADVFEAASATRHRWYELWYRVADSLWHRRSFDVEIQLRSRERALTKFTVLPSPWLDGPTGQHELGAPWHTPTPFRHTFVVLVPALGLLLSLQFLGPAFFNARRAILRRARPRR